MFRTELRCIIQGYVHTSWGDHITDWCLWHEQKEVPFSKSARVFDPMCFWTDTQKRSKASKWMLLLKNDASIHTASPPLPHVLTLVFSSSPYFRLPQSQEFAAGQKAAAEAQPIWSAAPPSWRSDREEVERLVVMQAAKSTSCFYLVYMHKQITRPVSTY